MQSKITTVNASFRTYMASLLEGNVSGDSVCSYIENGAQTDYGLDAPADSAIFSLIKLPYFTKYGITYDEKMKNCILMDILKHPKYKPNYAELNRALVLAVSYHQHEMARTIRNFIPYASEYLPLETPSANLGRVSTPIGLAFNHDAEDMVLEILRDPNIIIDINQFKVQAFGFLKRKGMASPISKNVEEILTVLLQNSDLITGLILMRMIFADAEANKQSGLYQFAVIYLKLFGDKEVDRAGVVELLEKSSFFLANSFRLVKSEILSGQSHKVIWDLIKSHCENPIEFFRGRAKLGDGECTLRYADHLKSSAVNLSEAAQYYQQAVRGQVDGAKTSYCHFIEEYKNDKELLCQFIEFFGLRSNLARVSIRSLEISSIQRLAQWLQVDHYCENFKSLSTSECYSKLKDDKIPLTDAEKLALNQCYALKLSEEEPNAWLTTKSHVNAQFEKTLQMKPSPSFKEAYAKYLGSDSKAGKLYYEAFCEFLEFYAIVRLNDVALAKHVRDCCEEAKKRGYLKNSKVEIHQSGLSLFGFRGKDKQQIEALGLVIEEEVFFNNDSVQPILSVKNRVRELIMSALCEPNTDTAKSLLKKALESDNKTYDDIVGKLRAANRLSAETLNIIDEINRVHRYQNSNSSSHPGSRPNYYHPPSPDASLVLPRPTAPPQDPLYPQLFADPSSEQPQASATPPAQNYYSLPPTGISSVQAEQTASQTSPPYFIPPSYGCPK